MNKKVVLVTGGAKGIGKGIATYLCEQAVVIIADNDEDAGYQCVSENPLLRFKCVDVTSEASVKSLILEIIQQHGQLDALINNAAISHPYNAPVEELELDEWHRVLTVNLTAPLLMAKHCTPHLRKQHGSIVNISSTRALQSEPHTEAYSASKGGLVALTHSLAVTLGPDIRVNCISPGWIDVSHTPLRDIDHHQHPVGHVGQPDDVASMVRYLISEEARFITGQNFIIDGGMTRKMIYQD